MKRISVISLIAVLLALIVVNVLSAYIFKRFDLTEDRRYSLSAPTLEIIENIDSPVIIDVLLSGAIPPEFEKLRVETELILEEFSAANNNIKFSFVNPLEDQEASESTIRQLQSIGFNSSKCDH